MHKRDQGARIIVNDATKKGDDTLIKIARKKMKQIDNENIIKAQYIIATYGWLSKDDIGEDANEALFFSIQHCDILEIQTKYLPILKTAVEAGKAEPWHYAFLTDRIKFNKGEKQIYGTQHFTSGSFSSVVPLVNPDSVDIYRKDMVLKPLSDGKWNLQDYKNQESEVLEKYKNWCERRDKR